MSTHVRVTEILSQFRDLSHIKCCVLKAKGEIGTEIHHNIHMHNCGIFPIFDNYPSYYKNGEIKGWSKRGEGYFDSYLEYEKLQKPSYKYMETRFYCDELMITGQIDGIRTNCSLPIITDFKSSANVDEEMWSMQAHYYKYLTSKNGIKTADHFEWVQLDPKGKFPNILRFNFDENMMSRCINEAIMYWENRSNAMIA